MDVQENSIKTEFMKNGYYIIPGAIERDRILEVRALLEKEFKKKFPQENLFSRKDLAKTDIIRDYLCVYPELIDLITNQSVVNIVKAILGENFYLMPPASCIRNSFGRLHTDLTTMTRHGYPIGLRDDFLGIVINIYLQDNDEQGGGIFIVPGSHKSKDPLIERRNLENGIGVPFFSKVLRKLTRNRYPAYEDYSIFEEGGVDVPSKIGDVTIMDMKILHRGSLPKMERNETKIGIFNLAMARTDTDILDYWMEYLYSDYDHPFHYLKQERNIQPLQRAAANLGFTAL